MRLLVVEDDGPARRMLVAALAFLGHVVAEAVDGADALERLEQERFHVVITDWKMPRMDGLTLCRRIREREGPYVYVLMITGMTDLKDHVDAFAKGVDDLLVKPFPSLLLAGRLRAAERMLGLIHLATRATGVMPMCAWCRQVRSDDGRWLGLEQYVAEHLAVPVTHGICPECSAAHLEA